MTVLGQNIDNYKWQNRVVVLMVNEENHPDLRTQLALFSQQLNELDDRKMIVIQSYPDFYKVGLDNRIKRTSNLQYFENKQQNVSFEVLLYGLDGGLKYRKEGVVNPEELYKIIDVMPMRQYEVDNKN